MFALAIISLAGCAGGASSNSSSPTPMSYDFSLSHKAEESLFEGTSLLSSREEFVKALDYLAFHEVKQKVKFAFSSEYRASFYNPYQEFLAALKTTDIAESLPVVCDTDPLDEEGYIAIRMSQPKDYGTHASDPDGRIALARKGYEPQNRMHALPIFSKGLPEVEVETSEQLYHALSSGYLPKPKESSRAELLFEELIDICNKQVDEDETDLIRAYSLYRYMSDEVRYDFSIAYTSDTYLYPESAYYLDGPLLHNLAVCDGIAKTYVSLLRMEGFEAVRATGKNAQGDDHAWAYLKMDEKWYTSCPTYGRLNSITIEGSTYAIGGYHMFLASKETPYKEKWGYVPNGSSEIYDSLEESAYPLPYSNDPAGPFWKVDETGLDSLGEEASKLNPKEAKEFVTVPSLSEESLLNEVGDKAYLIPVKDDIPHYLLVKI